ncbi:hypothetical protein DFH06DRAFT_977728 [Mycena polygramma]|nr:hypothetical protein DFH06DRAFT_977728 [Mycena polygramma]
MGKYGLTLIRPHTHAPFFSPTPLVDKRGRIIGVLVESPRENTDWNAVVAAATAAIDRVKPHVDYERLPMHGNTPHSLRRGIEYYGWGATSQAQNLKHTSTDNLVELQSLQESAAIRDISRWQNTVHQRFAPRLHAYMRYTKDALMANDPALRDNSTGGAFPAVEFFLGNDESPPTLHDLDMMWAWRALTALGEYDSRWGGELILWEEKKVFRFPPGSTFLFPGTLVRYSFTQVRSGERQYSFSQYAQAGLYRYLENGFMSESVFDATAWRWQREARERVKDARMAKALGMYSQLSELSESQ